MNSYRNLLERIGNYNHLLADKLESGLQAAED